MGIIYAYRDATEALEEILSENKQGEPEQKKKLARLCEKYLNWAGEDEEEETAELEDEEKMTWRELLEVLDGDGLIVTNLDEVNDTLDGFGTDLDSPVDTIETF